MMHVYRQLLHQNIFLVKGFFFFFLHFEVIFRVFVLSAIHYHLSPSKMVDVFKLVLKGPLLTLQCKHQLTFLRS